MDSMRIPTTNNPMILRVTFDSMLTFNRYVAVTTKKIKNRKNAPNAIADSSWGKEKRSW